MILRPLLPCAFALVLFVVPSTLSAQGSNFTYSADLVSELDRLVVGEPEVAVARLDELMPSGKWCRHGPEGDVDAAQIQRMFANLGVVARRTGRLGEAVDCAVHAFHRSGGLSRAAAFFESALLVRRASEPELEGLRGILLDGARAGCPEAAHSEAVDRVATVMGQERDIAHAAGCLLPDPRKLTSESRERAFRELVIAAALQAPRESYLQRLSREDRVRLWNQFDRNLPSLVGSVDLKGERMDEYLFQTAYSGYVLQRSDDAHARPKNKEELEDRWERNGGQGSIVSKTSTIDSKTSEGQTISVKLVCGGHQDSPGSAYLIDDATFLFLTVEQGDDRYAASLGPTAHCAEQHAGSSTSVEFHDAAVTVTTVTEGSNAAGDIGRDTGKLICGVAARGHFQCLKSVTYSSEMDRAGRTVAFRNMHDVIEYQQPGAPGFELEEGRIKVLPPKTDFWFKEYAELDGLALGEALQRVPAIKQSVQARVVGLVSK